MNATKEQKQNFKEAANRIRALERTLRSVSTGRCDYSVKALDEIIMATVASASHSIRQALDTLVA